MNRRARELTRLRQRADERLGRVTTGVTVAAVGLTAVLSAGVAIALPGHAKGARVTVPSGGAASGGATASGVGGSTAAAGSSASAGNTGSGSSLSSPAQAPVQTVPVQTPVVSGGS